MCIIQSFSITIGLLRHLRLNVDPFKSTWMWHLWNYTAYFKNCEVTGIFFSWKISILRSRFVSLSPSINIYFYCCQSCWHTPVTLMRWPCRAVNYIYITAVAEKKRKEKKRRLFQVVSFSFVSFQTFNQGAREISLFPRGDIHSYSTVFLQPCSIQRQSPHHMEKQIFGSLNPRKALLCLQ